MAAVGDEPAGCDGCGRTAPLEELTTVTMPDGEQVVCCQHCEPHARAAAERGGSLDQRRDTCDGCTGTFRLAKLEDVVLDDGTVVTCCPSCVAQAPNRDDDGGSDTDGTDEDITEGPTAATDSERSTEAGPDEDRRRCSQCREQVSEELFRVTTIDERTERLCADCKSDAEERGIVTDVEMRKTRAREVLGVDAGASDETLRKAYHEQVKRAHPDRSSGSRSAFGLVTDAYERLRDGD